MNKKGSKHLTIDDRKMIENLLSKNLSCKEIAFEISKDDRTVSREIKDRRSIKECFKSYFNNKHDKTPCKKLNRFPYVCNGCNERRKCFRTVRYYYNADSAQKDAETLLVSSRVGLDISEEDFNRYNSALVDAIQKGQSVHHIAASNADIPYSERTIYRHIDEQLVDVKSIDLRRKVKYKKRKHYIYRDDNKQIRDGRRYVDFLSLIALENPISITEIDTVEGPSEGKHKCLLTIHFTAVHFMLIYVLESKSKENVSNVFRMLKHELGLELYSRLFHICLTDRGTEFCDPTAVELDENTGEKLCSIFYCDSYSSYQKGSIEENHELVRYILPKKHDFDFLTQEQANLISSHINNYYRKTIDDTPYDLALEFFGKEFLEKTKTKPVAPDLVTLKPSLLH